MLLIFSSVYVVPWYNLLQNIFTQKYIMYYINAFKYLSRFNLFNGSVRRD